ncbi:MAG: hypothetical protein MZV70_52605 [Desulfobacterales bacterium]|nr:hypothetical protein [Desulfobacterales bacterium]
MAEGGSRPADARHSARRSSRSASSGKRRIWDRLAQVRYDTSYREQRLVHWDGYVDVRGNRYSVPDHLCGKQVEVRIGIDGRLARLCRRHSWSSIQRLRPASGRLGYTVPSHHRRLWQKALSGGSAGISQCTRRWPNAADRSPRDA